MNRPHYESITLEGGKFYNVTLLHYNEGRESIDFATLGVTLPDGTELAPIPKKYLWLQIPGKF